MNELTCLNCKKPVAAGEGDLFAEVFLCSACATIAKSFYIRMENELRQLLVLGKETIRIALVQGKFHLSEQRLKELSKKEVLEQIIRMESLKKDQRVTTEQCPPQEGQETSSGTSTPPHVATLAALGRSSSTKPSPAD